MANFRSGRCRALIGRDVLNLFTLRLMNCLVHLVGFKIIILRLRLLWVQSNYFPFRRLFSVIPTNDLPTGCKLPSPGVSERPGRATLAKLRPRSPCLTLSICQSPESWMRGVKQTERLLTSSVCLSKQHPNGPDQSKQHPHKRDRSRRGCQLTLFMSRGAFGEDGLFSGQLFIWWWLMERCRMQNRRNMLFRLCCY